MLLLFFHTRKKKNMQICRYVVLPRLKLTLRKSHTSKRRQFFYVNWSMCAQLLSPVRLFATPWTVARQAPLSMGFPRQEEGSGLPFPSPKDLPSPGIQHPSSVLAEWFFTTEPQPAEPMKYPLNGDYDLCFRFIKTAHLSEFLHSRWKLSQLNKKNKRWEMGY